MSSPPNIRDFSTAFCDGPTELASFEEFFQGGKIYCYANFFYVNFLLFSDQISGGKSLRGGNCLRGCPPAPLEESQKVKFEIL